MIERKSPRKPLGDRRARLAGSPSSSPAPKARKASSDAETPAPASEKPRRGRPRKAAADE